MVKFFKNYWQLFFIGAVYGLLGLILCGIIPSIVAIVGLSVIILVLLLYIFVYVQANGL
jgi:ABC-type multidrug transport system permease subunit